MMQKSRTVLYRDMIDGPAPQYDFCGQRGPCRSAAPSLLDLIIDGMSLCDTSPHQDPKVGE
jgi:hypothetical protein